MMVNVTSSKLLLHIYPAIKRTAKKGPALGQDYEIYST